MVTAARKHDVFQAIADPTRRTILTLLVKKELSVTQISHHFTMSRPAVSKHLRILHEAQLIQLNKVGRESIYGIENEAFTELKEWLAYFDHFWDNKLDQLRVTVEKED